MDAQELIRLRQRVAELEDYIQTSHAVVDFSPYGICVNDITGRILMANQTAAQRFG